ncbi:MAG TPA: hypothetical protein PLI09_20705 [Candidatus Hydrogenedentes bacterium]|nr:hypothetical protein [Candidatus Hydrogenedentota bacterium]
MKHIVKLSRTPSKAMDISWGTIITVVANILSVIGQAWEDKDSANV